MARLEFPYKNESRWYTFVVFPSKEVSVKFILEELKIVESVIIPVRTIIEMKKEQRREYNSKQYPGHIFVKLKLDEKAWELLFQTYGVLDMLPDRYHPIPLKKSEVAKLVGSVDVERKELAKRLEFDDEDTIEVLNGPFARFQGRVISVSSERQTVRVEIDIFGRLTPLDLDALQVRKISKIEQAV